jgi:hypothetical protein
MSPVCRETRENEIRVHVDIYRRKDRSGWLLEVIDDPSDTNREALNALREVIEKDGTRSFLEGDSQAMHRVAWTARSGTSGRNACHPHRPSGWRIGHLCRNVGDRPLTLGSAVSDIAANRGTSTLSTKDGENRALSVAFILRDTWL